LKNYFELQRNGFELRLTVKSRHQSRHEVNWKQRFRTSAKRWVWPI